jgi:hypothetical protein
MPYGDGILFRIDQKYVFVAPDQCYDWTASFQLALSAKREPERQRRSLQARMPALQSER